MRKLLHIAFFLGVFLFSYWLMFQSFRSTPEGNLQISSKSWSDFGSHLPLIRSFSFGSNWPPQYPLYPNQPIKYHFLYYALVGLLEHIGLPLVFVLNFTSALGFAAMVYLVYFLAVSISGQKKVGYLASLLVFFNGSFSWLDFLRTSSISRLWSLDHFVSFGPWNSSDIWAFWSLNIFTNQRHLGLSFALVFLCLYFLYKKSRRGVYFIGLIIGLLCSLNMAAAAISLASVLSFVVFDRHGRGQIILSMFGILPGLVIFNLFISPGTTIYWHPGFLLPEPITLSLIAKFWFKNLGLHIFLIPLGIYFAPRRAKIFILPLLGLIILPNLLQFSPDMFNNHKFFNFFIILGSIFSSLALIRLKYIGLLLLPFVIAGGIVDLMPLKNDTFYTLTDYQQNPDISFFLDHTSSSDIVLNSTWFYHPASLAGRKIFNGYSYFTWSYGYDQVSREETTKQIYASEDTLSACLLLRQNHISFVELSSHPESFLSPNVNLWSNWSPEYSNPTTGITVYSVSKNCTSI